MVLVGTQQIALAFSQYHAEEFRNVAPYYRPIGYNRSGQYSSTLESGQLVTWSSSGGTTVIGMPNGIPVSLSADQALSENGDAGVVVGGVVTSNLYSYSHIRGWESLPYTNDTDVIEMRFKGYSNNDIIAVEGVRPNFQTSRIYRYVRSNDNWVLQFANAAGLITSTDRVGNIYYGKTGSIIKPFIWKTDGTQVQLSMGQYSDGQVFPLGSDLSGKVYGSAWRPNGSQALIVWDTWSSAPRVLLDGVLPTPRFSGVNDSGLVCVASYVGNTSETWIGSESQGFVELQSLLDASSSHFSIGSSYYLDNMGEVTSFQHGINLPPLFVRPVPEPSSLVLMGAGVGFFAIRRKKRPGRG